MEKVWSWIFDEGWTKTVMVCGSVGMWTKQSASWRGQVRQCCDGDDDDDGRQAKRSSATAMQNCTALHCPVVLPVLLLPGLLQVLSCVTQADATVCNNRSPPAVGAVASAMVFLTCSAPFAYAPETVEVVRCWGCVCCV